MKRNVMGLLATALLLTLATALQAQVRMVRDGLRAHIEVKGQPMIILGGELSNSAATSGSDISRVLYRLRTVDLNTVLVPAQWDLIEPEEGKFDFSLIDSTLVQARRHQMKVVFLWFGAWKNSMSCYAPLWFKQDTRRFPRARTANGKPLEIATAFSDNVWQADNRAFSALMRHIKAVDSEDNTVIMVQVENEIGMLESARDHCRQAEDAYRQPVPKELLKALKISKSGTWSEVFGTDAYADEKFQAWHYARYVERLCQSAKAIYDIPLFVNAAMNSRGRQPGEYPSAGPLAHLADIWQCAAPSLSLLAPDIYDTGFKSWAAQYDMDDNPLFIPESRCSINSGIRALYTLGAHEAVGFCPFDIDHAKASERQEIRRAYEVADQLQPLLLEKRGKGGVNGVLFDKDDRETVIADGDLQIVCRHYFTLPWDPRATDGTEWREGGAVIIKLGPLEYLVAGSGVVVEFKTRDEWRQETRKRLGEDGFAEQGTANADKTMTSSAFTGKRIGIGPVDEVKADGQGKFTYLRRLNGDQTHQGRHVRISVGDWQILHVKLYEYQ
jgi:GH35 family endo-1,4-beta-xylanase